MTPESQVYHEENVTGYKSRGNHDEGKADRKEIYPGPVVKHGLCEELTCQQDLQ